MTRILIIGKNSAFDRDPVQEVHSPRACRSLRTFSPAVLPRQYLAWRKDHIDVGSLVCFLLGKVSCVTLISEAIPPIPYDYYLPKSNNLSFASNFKF